MVTFLLCVIILIAGFIIYGRIAEKCFRPDGRETPANKLRDDVDYIPMPMWKVYLIQLLNIAGTGPIFGALSGAVFGPVVYLWIVLGCIFIGGVHDYMCAMISMRHDGASVAEVTGIYLGDRTKVVVRAFSLILLVMCGVVFTIGPAELLEILTSGKLTSSFWFWVVISYYFIATFLPIDKVIGRIYPLFGICLIIMALGVGGSLVISPDCHMPELWNNLSNQNPSGLPIWPFLFITVACGAVSGFHATQSPMMARCCKDERQGRYIFYGAMVTEGLIALVWAAAGVSCYESSQELLEAGAGCSAVVYEVCQTTMGKIGCVLAMVGVVACPISSGDTAFRSARLTIADWFRIDQKDWRKRLAITAPILIAGAVISQLDYQVVWRYCAWANQTLAMIALWVGTAYLKKHGKNWVLMQIPAMVMTAVTATYFIAAPECMGTLWNMAGISTVIYYPAAAAAGVIFAIYVFFRMTKKWRKGGRLPDSDIDSIEDRREP